ncbi:quinic acid utilization activator [Clathrospora elynae]|uniref:Quinic acid utilization activator n=1 Tax=Clathrospora elynae TaxID=706981 RepID=A0A6A5SYD8_9PLEO|nr:quinic acid utilization activator [Clathrospora elynae]
MTLAYVFQHNTDIEASLYSQLAQNNTVLLAKGTKEANRLHKSWTKSRFCRDITKALSGEQIGVGDDKTPSSDEESDMDTEDATLLQMTSNSQTCPLAPWTSGTSCIAQDTATLSSPDNLRPNTQHSTSSSLLTPLPTECWKLLETYCMYTQCWLPISDKLDILKLSYSYPEQGLALTSEMPRAGCHAEMWSIFAVGSTQNNSNAVGGNEGHRTMSPEEIYATARLLIPNELGDFHLDHIKALLNLAVFNVNRSLFNAAWLLVGAASRIFLTLDDTLGTVTPRRKNVLYSCILLDSLLALHLKQRPYLDRSDLVLVGKIEEDGMEEWQLWDGQLKLGPMRQSRSPTLALSSFNALLELVDILVNTTRQPTARNFLHEMIGRLETWKSSLPPKLDYIRNDSAATPMTPPALLLQLAYFATNFALVPSQALLHQTLDMLELLQGQLDFVRMPSIVICLLQSIKRCTSRLALDQGAQNRTRKLFAAFDQAYSRSSDQAPMDPLNMLAMDGTSPDAFRLRNVEMAQLSPRSFSSQTGGLVAERYQHSAGSSSLLDNLLPDINLGRQEHAPQSFMFNPFDFAMTGQTADINDPYNAFVSGDQGSSFDEIASRLGVKKSQNQPQFMENLGYSSGLSMADLLAADPGRFMSTSLQFAPDNSEHSPQFPLNSYYDAG